jgi:predicted membrane channel-forming protein YqfA (hemolysin III family)
MKKIDKWVLVIYGVLVLTGLAAIVFVWVDPNPPSRVNFTLWVIIALIWVIGSFLKEYKKEK